MKKAVYAGSFDPPTNGHRWVVDIGANLFDELMVVVGDNPGKAPTYTSDERVEMLANMTRNYDNVSVGYMGNVFTINYARDHGASYLLRGIRNIEDYYKEEETKKWNERFDPSITTVFVFPPDQLGIIRSSSVKGLIGPRTWERKIADLVPKGVYRSLLEKNGGLRSDWNGLWKSIGASNDPETPFNALVSRYTERGRRYHDITHIAYGLNELSDAVDAGICKKPDQLGLALFYHDAVYEPSKPGNEEKSASLAAYDLWRAGARERDVEGVYDLVMCTDYSPTAVAQDRLRHHPDSAVIVDIDLSPLGVKPSQFLENEKDIRFEYSSVDDRAFAEGRLSILKSFMDKESIYRTRFFKDRYESQARSNLEDAIERHGSVKAG